MFFGSYEGFLQISAGSPQCPRGVRFGSSEYWDIFGHWVTVGSAKKFFELILKYEFAYHADYWIGGP